MKHKMAKKSICVSIDMMIELHEQRHMEPSIEARANQAKKSTFVDSKDLDHVPHHMWKGCGKPHPKLPNVKVS